MLTMLKGHPNMRSPFNRNFIEKVPQEKMQHVLLAAEAMIQHFDCVPVKGNRLYNIEFYAKTIQDVQRVLAAIGTPVNHSEFDRINNGYKLFKQGQNKNSFAFARINARNEFTVILPMAKNVKELDAFVERFNSKADTGILEQIDAFCLITSLHDFVTNPIKTQNEYMAFCQPAHEEHVATDTPIELNLEDVPTEEELMGISEEMESLMDI